MKKPLPQIELAAAALLAALAVIAVLSRTQTAHAGLAGAGYSALDPIRSGNLTIFPVVAYSTHDTKGFLTLDDGLRSGQVVVTEEGSTGLVRRRGDQPNNAGPQVNELALENNSKQPLLLLAGEIVTGGRQDRIVGKDLIIPAGEATDLNVFCVEPGRWTPKSTEFGAAGNDMAQPSVRKEAMANQDQSGVWQKVRQTQGAMETVEVTAGAPGLDSTTSYAQVMANTAVSKHVDSVAAPIERNYSSLITTLRDRHAVGVVVAVNGSIIWADLFASSQLLEKYWPKLIRSYAAESVTTTAGHGKVDRAQAQHFLEEMSGTHEVTDTEPGVYSYSQTQGAAFKVFRLTSLLPETGFDVHIAKMAQ